MHSVSAQVCMCVAYRRVGTNASITPFRGVLPDGLYLISHTLFHPIPFPTGVMLAAAAMTKTLHHTQHIGMYV
jgi:hypothetical protein